MKLEEFARVVLFGESLEAKLTGWSQYQQVSNRLAEPEEAEMNELQTSPPSSPIEIPKFPGRPPSLSKVGKAVFPSVHQLDNALERARVLHFFANHELLAMELMALLLLRFPSAPYPFRKGVAEVIQEEQNHLRLYISRMNELGIEFGDIPVNDYFWNSMKGMKSPLDFTVQMSLTFEQANLDFSLFFMNAVKRVGDHETALILERVFREEIGHVKHGLNWFNRWRDQSNHENDWDAYVRLLPSPLTPQRAKGFEFSTVCEDARRQAGFSENYIRELRLYSGSKGRPPVLWIYNPHCESEISRGKPGYSPKEGSRKLTADLEHIPMFLCHSQDVVLVKKRPSSDWIDSLHKTGFKIPEFIEIRDPDISRTIGSRKIGGIEPWGWSPDVFSIFHPLRNLLVNTAGGNSAFCQKLFSDNSFEKSGIGKLFSKNWSVQFLRDWVSNHPETHSTFGSLNQVGTSLSDWDTIELRIKDMTKQGQPVVVKAPFGTSGMQIRKINQYHELQGPAGGWIRKTLSSQGSIILEYWLEKIANLSIQMEISEDRIQLLEARQFLTGSHHEYRGTYLGKKMPGLDVEQLRLFHSLLPTWHCFLRDLGQQLRKEGYLGPVGVDAFFWKNGNNETFLKPLVEINPRWTMGRISLELEKHLVPGKSGIWIFYPLREILKHGFANALQFAQELNHKYPLQLSTNDGVTRIESGVIFTNDPAHAQSTLSILATLPNSDLNCF